MTGDAHLLFRNDQRLLINRIFAGGREVSEAEDLDLSARRFTSRDLDDDLGADAPPCLHVYGIVESVKPCRCFVVSNDFEHTRKFEVAPNDAAHDDVFHVRRERRQDG